MMYATARAEDVCGEQLESFEPLDWRENQRSIPSLSARVITKILVVKLYFVNG